MLNRIKARIHWQLAKKRRGNDIDSAAKHILASIKSAPTYEDRARRGASILVSEGRYADAGQICRHYIERGDPLEFWSHYESFVQELEAGSLAGQGKITGVNVALLNDTDFRVNIGCRLTSQGLKNLIRQSISGARISSHGFRFSAFRHDFKTEAVSRDAAQLLEERVRVAYGSETIAAIKASDVVILQPEGSLDDGTTLEGLKTFFSPIILAQNVGKPNAIINGTIPVYEDERGGFLRNLFSSLPSVAARDDISAAHYGIKFIADAAFLYKPATDNAERDGCLITTGARNSVEEDERIFHAALEVCDATGLRPIVLTHAVDRFKKFEKAIRSRNGIFAETASLTKAAETLARCRLHVGARYHMAIFCVVAQVPSLLYDVKTHKNKWLGRYSPLITLAAADRTLVAQAKEILSTPIATGTPDDGLEKLSLEFLKGSILSQDGSFQLVRP